MPTSIISHIQPFFAGFLCYFSQQMATSVYSSLIHVFSPFLAPFVLLFRGWQLLLFHFSYSAPFWPLLCYFSRGRQLLSFHHPFMYSALFCKVLWYFFTTDVNFYQFQFYHKYRPIHLYHKLTLNHCFVHITIKGQCKKVPFASLFNSTLEPFAFTPATIMSL